MKPTLLTLFFISTLNTFAQCDDFELNVTFNNPTCYGFSDGSITLSTSGGGESDAYTITNTDGDVLNPGGSNTANSLPEGLYQLHVIDDEGCEIDSTMLLESPGLIDIDLTTADSNGEPECDGYAVVDSVYNYSGDYNNISFFWSPDPEGISGIGADSNYNFCPGPYTLTINDDAGCSNSFEFSIGGEVASISNSTEQTFTLIHNKVTNEITIQTNHNQHPLVIDIYDGSGRKVYSQTLSGSQTTFTPSLNGGIYLYAVREKDQILSSGKFVFE